MARKGIIRPSQVVGREPSEQVAEAVSLPSPLSERATHRSAEPPSRPPWLEKLPAALTGNDRSRRRYAACCNLLSANGLRTRPAASRRDGWGLSATVKVNGDQRENRFPADTPIRKIRAWRDETRVALRSTVPRKSGGSFREDAARYLARVRAMPSYRERERNIGFWVEEFGDRRRSAVTTEEIAQVLQRWERDGYAASTLNHRRGALRHLWATLDGKHAENPVASLPRYREPRPEPRGLSWSDVDRLLSVMPDVGQAIRGRIRDDASKTKARLAVMAFTGLTHSQLKQLRPADIFWREGAFRAPARHKGRGASAQVLPLNRRGLEALARFAELGCWGEFSSASLNKSFKRACEKVGLVGKRAYDLRHAFGTEMYRRTHDPLVVQQLMLHRSPETTRRYILAAVPDVLQRAIERVDRASTAGSTGWQSGADPTPGSAKWLKRMERETGVEPATFSLGS